MRLGLVRWHMLCSVEQADHESGRGGRARILIVEDDDEMRGLLTRLLRTEGYQIKAVSTSLEALAVRDPDLVLVDIMLGEEDGRDLLKELRHISDVPVVFLTGRGHEMDRIAGLKMGADDYIVKPFSSGELSARLESVLRRSGSPIRRVSGGSDLHFGALRIDPFSREIELDGRLVDMTAKEFDLILYLASSPRRVFSRQQLLEQVWASPREWRDEATVTEHIRRIRRKIETEPNGRKWITTVRGAGYRFEPGGSRQGQL